MTLYMLEVWHTVYDDQVARFGIERAPEAVRHADFAARTCAGAVLSTEPGGILVYTDVRPQTAFGGSRVS